MLCRRRRLEQRVVDIGRQIVGIGRRHRMREVLELLGVHLVEEVVHLVIVVTVAAAVARLVALAVALVIRIVTAVAGAIAGLVVIVLFGGLGASLVEALGDLVGQQLDQLFHFMFVSHGSPIRFELIESATKPPKEVSGLFLCCNIVQIN